MAIRTLTGTKRGGTSEDGAKRVDGEFSVTLET